MGIIKKAKSLFDKIQQSKGLGKYKFKGWELYHIYSYDYDPKYKDTLAFYDQHPLIIYLGKNKYSNHQGLNLHFLQKKWRVKLFKEFRFRSDGKAGQESILKGLNTVKALGPILLMLSHHPYKLHQYLLLK